MAYCSSECQTVDWKARHKHECGKRFEVGEKFCLKALVSRPELNGRRVVVEHAKAAATGRVGVRILAEAETGGEDGDEAEAGLVISVKPANLRKFE